ncbi:hypothetical protein [Bosea sp. BK604]|nr:hypothetical protein [Bosea sp. BK604]TCR64739.1 hypothetical protein EV560_106205 [Bosea sp. BK604]
MRGIRRFWNADILARPDEVGDTLWHDLEGRIAYEPSKLELSVTPVNL